MSRNKGKIVSLKNNVDKMSKEVSHGASYGALGDKLIKKYAKLNKEIEADKLAEKKEKERFAKLPKEEQKKILKEKRKGVFLQWLGIAISVGAGIGIAVACDHFFGDKGKYGVVVVAVVLLIGCYIAATVNSKKK